VCPTRERASQSCTVPKQPRSRSLMFPEEAFARDFSYLSIRQSWSAMSPMLQQPAPNVKASTMAGTVRVLIVDDEPLARDCMRLALRGVPGVKIVAECGDGASAVEAIRLHGP